MSTVTTANTANTANNVNGSSSNTANNAAADTSNAGGRSKLTAGCPSLPMFHPCVGRLIGGRENNFTASGKPMPAVCPGGGSLLPSSTLLVAAAAAAATPSGVEEGVGQGGGGGVGGGGVFVHGWVVSSQQCAEGHVGTMCAACADGWVSNTDNAGCTACQLGATASRLIVVAIVAGKERDTIFWCVHQW